MGRKINHLIVAFLLLQFLSATGTAGIARIHQRLQDSVSTSGKDTVWVEINPKTGSFKDERVTDYVTVGIDPFYHKYITDTSQYIISLSFDAYDASNSFVSSTSHTFTVTHDLFGKTSMRDKDLFKFNGAYRYKVTFVSATKNGSSITRLPDYIYIDADIEVERYYYFASYSSSTFTVTSNELNIDCDSLSTPDELEISWNACFASAAVCPESYDLEWTFVNDYTSTSGSYKSASLLDYDFGGNSTRISTTDNKYRVSLVYEHGYIIYRVRGIGRDTANVNIPIVGAWSLAESGTVSSASSSRYHVTQSHEGNKNWQYNASFAEEGKKKEVVSYFDGSLRNRQSVTKMNSSNNAIVGETIYDHQGRPAINVLPVPVDFPTCDSSSQPAIRFYPNFNQDDSTFAYTRNDFDLDSTGYSCISPTGPMGTSSGASHYYSPSNPDKTDQQAFVPDANKYPFTQVEYTPDNTGRIRTQGGVGPVFQLNSGHATQYFYGQPTQIELDRMFGSEVGDALHYKKNIVIDANGQASMTYLDMEGRTIATSLAGEIDTNRLSPLSSYSASVNLTADLFNKNSRGVSGLNKINSEGNAVVFSTQLLVSNNGYHDFSYNVIVDTLADSCLRENVCFSCIYDLEMHVYNGCGEDKLAQYRGDTLKKTIGHFSIDTLNNLVFTTVCSDSNRVNELDTFNLFLEAGNYTISKTLRVNKNALDYYVAQYLDSTNNSCYRTRNSFVAEEMGNVDTSGCHVTCASCLAKLGDRDAFVADGKGSYMEYDALADACQAPCKALSECYIHYLQMVSDVSLGGQYGQYQDNSGNMNPTPYALSVYNTQNYLPKNLLVGPYGSAIPSGTGNWRHPQVRLNNVDYTHYVDENGHISMISIALVSPGVYSPLVVSTSTTVVKYDSLTNTYYTYPENLADFDDFARNWKAAWAKSLVKYHPEYCYYETCSGFGEKASGDYTTSDDFDIILRSTTTFGSAASIGLTNIANFTNVNDSLPYDPFLLRYSTYGTRLSNLLSTYSPQPLSGYTLNMQQMAAYATRCGMQYGNHDTTGCIDFGSAAPDSIKDLEWNTFKGMYLSAKQLLQQEYMTGIVKSGSCPGYNGCFNVTFNGHGSYELYGEYGDIFQPCGSATFFLYTNKIPRFGDAATFMPTTINQIAYESYLVTGQCPVTTDLQNLLNQVAINGKLKIASNDSLKDYNRFTPRLYQALGGSNNHYSEFTWNSITSGDTITSSFKDSAGATVCSLVIDLSTSGIGTFSNYKVIGFSGLSDTTYTPHHAHSFRAYMALHDTVADTIVYKKVLGYTSCFDLTGCKFDQTCMPNDFAIDLQNLMSVLANNHKIATSHVYLTDTLYRPYITFPIKNELGTTTSDSLVWNYNNFGKRFELYDSLNPSLKIIIHLGDTASIDFDDTLVFANIYAFKNINSLYENNFSIQIIDSLKSNDVTLKGFVQKKSGSTVLSGISMGSCGYPTSFNCEGAQYKLQNDLQQLVHDALVSMPSSHDVDLTKLPGFTYLLKSMFPLNLDSTSSVLFTDASDTTNYRSHLVFTIKSTIDSTYTDSCYFVLRADTVHGFDSIV
ncbi:MAG: DUF6443 domain-containing protein, partial [Bacteroidia bacterium]